MTVVDSHTASRVLLRDAGLRVTALRLSALDLVEANPHATADLIFGRLQEQHDGTSIQATYNVLNDLHGAGLRLHLQSLDVDSAAPGLSGEISDCVLALPHGQRAWAALSRRRQVLATPPLAHRPTATATA